MSHPFTRTVRDYQTLASTSDTARELVMAGGIELPLLVIAREQTAGRGRGDHSWWSGEGSLTFTLAIDPKAHGLRPEHEARVALAVAVAICWVNDGVKARIRWPNDLECDGRKLAGILPERVETDAGPRLLIGVGLNVTNRFEDAPEDIRAMATSIAREDGEYDGGWDEDYAAEHLECILDTMPGILAQLAADDPKLADEWRHRDILLGRYVRLKTGDAVITGIGAGIAPDGGLRIRAVGEEAKVHYGGQVLRD